MAQQFGISMSESVLTWDRRDHHSAYTSSVDGDALEAQQDDAMPLETLGIRMASRSDAEEVARCLAAFRDFEGKSGPPDEALAEGVQHALDRGLVEFLLVGRPAHSYVQLRYIYSAWHQSNICWVEDVYVGDEYRGLGLGRALMRATQSRASELGCVRL